MSVLLTQGTAKQPFYFEKLELHIYSREELSYVIANYPVLCLTGFVSDTFIGWIGSSLGMTGLSEKLSDGRRDGKDEGSMLLWILEECGYYQPSEIREIERRIAGLSKQPSYRILRETGNVLYRAGRPGSAGEKYEEALSAVNTALIHASSEKEFAALSAEKADLLCDLSCVRMLRFDTKGALRYLELSSEAGRSKRAEEYKYLITGEADLSESEKEALCEKREKLCREAGNSAQVRAIGQMAALDSRMFFSQAEKIVAGWKEDFRKTS